jgi:hypothetical protein
MAISTALGVGVLALVLSRPAQSFQGAKRIAKGTQRGGGVPQLTQLRIAGDKATAVVSTSDRTEFVQRVRSSHKWLVVPPQRERIDF